MIFPSFSFFIVFAAGLASTAEAQIPAGFGACPKMNTVPDFDLKKFEGKWYEVERTFYFFEIIGNCPSFNFTLRDDGNLDVLFSMKNRMTNNVNTYKGLAKPKGDDKALWDYRASVSRLPQAISRILPGSGKYYILATDYDNYAVMWTCSNFGFAHSDLYWILGREQSLSPNSRAKAYQSLSETDIDQKRLLLSKHDNCPI